MGNLLKKRKKSSKNKVEDSDEYMRRIIFSTEDDNVKTSKQQPSSIPTLTPTNYNSNLFQNMAPTMNYKYFNGNTNSLPNYYNQMNSTGPMSPVAGPMSPYAGPMSQVAGPMSQVAGPMSPYAGSINSPVAPTSGYPF